MGRLVMPFRGVLGRAPALLRAALPRVPAGRRPGPRLLAVTAVLACLVADGPAVAAEPSSAGEATGSTVWGMGDSLFLQCGDTLGVGSSSLGMVGWWGGTTADMRARMSSTATAWPYMTERSHADELAHYRNAGVWVIGLGTNDVRLLTVEQYRANVDWFLRSSQGRPVLWFDIHRANYGPQVAAFNAVLRDAARRWSNLRILGWQAYVAAHPGVIHGDRLHIADHQGCRDGRFRLIRDALRSVGGGAAGADVVVAPPSPDPVTSAYEGAGGPSGPLGAAAGALSCGRKYSGCHRSFAGGAIAWSPRTGAHVVPSALAAWWRRYAETGPLGYPVATAACDLADGGCRQRFETGTLVWSPTTGAHEVSGPMGARWVALGAEQGRLGYPVSEPFCGLREGGCGQHFEGGSLYWSVAAGARMTYGSIRSRWFALGAERGGLRYPTRDPLCGLPGGGCLQHFQGGSLYWSAHTGTRLVRGAIRSRWWQLGAEGGLLGYPSRDELCGLTGGGCLQHFERGSLYWSPRTGAHPVQGSLRSGWYARGAETGRLGYPTSDPYAVRGGTAQRFQGGTLAVIGGRVRQI